MRKMKYQRGTAGYLIDKLKNHTYNLNGESEQVNKIMKRFRHNFIFKNVFSKSKNQSHSS